MDEKQKKPVEIRPQPGPQTDFLETKADIGIYGGAAGGGKTYALLLDQLRHFENDLYGGVIFRRTTKQIRNEGGLWDTATALYLPLGFEPKESTLKLIAPSKMQVQFAHLEHEKNIFDWQGSQLPFIGFDELTHFTQKMFFYMMSRLRSTSGVPGYIRATVNPDADSWVREFIDWWIGEDGLPIPERAGKLRWFIRVNDQLIWANSREELIKTYGPDELPKSVTFIPSKLADNKILMAKDPGYLANLRALSKVERERLLDGNWNIRAVAGNLFRREWFDVVDTIPAGSVAVRYWDRAATEVKPEDQQKGRVGKPKKKADWTAGCKLYRAPDGTYIIADMVHAQYSPGKVQTTVKNTAAQDTVSVPVWVEQEPGSSGVADVHAYIKLLSGFRVHANRPTVDKVTRAGPASAQCEGGNVKLLRGKWNEAFLTEAENFPDGDNDDQVDAFTGAFNVMQGPQATPLITRL